ncbi:MAG: hypothetical protein R2912_11330 [Eubacteriales bacterium]
MMGREIKLAEPATRVVALSAADCEILYAIGAGDMLVGRGEFCDYPAEVLDVPAVQSAWRPTSSRLSRLPAGAPDERHGADRRSRPNSWKQLAFMLSYQTQRTSTACISRSR